MSELPVVQRPTHREYRCRNCGRMLCTAVLVPGARVTIRCPRCGNIRTLYRDLPEVGDKEILRSDS